jgi:ribosome maturation protein SDO1
VRSGSLSSALIAFALQIAVIDPGSLRLINELLETETKGRGRVETLSFSSVADGDEALE